MGSLRENYMTIRGDFGSTGLDRAQSRIRTEEGMLWSTENAMVDQRGTIRKKSLFYPAGQPLYSPVAPNTDDNEQQSLILPFNQLDWEPVALTLNNADIRIGLDGSCSFSAALSTLGTSTIKKYRRSPLVTESYNIDPLYDETMSVSFTMHCQYLFSTAITAATDPGFHIAAAVKEDNLLHIGFSQLGMYVAGNGAYQLIPGSAGLFDTNTPIKVDVLMTKVLALYNVALSVDGTSIGSVNLAGLDTTDGQLVDIAVCGSTGVAASEYCSGSIGALALSDNNQGTIPAEVTETFSVPVTYRGVRWPEHSLHAVAGQHLWRSNGVHRLWNPLFKLDYPNTNSVNYRGDKIIFAYDDNNSTVYRYGINEDPVILDDAPNVKFGTVHLGRLFAAGDPLFPRRLYFTSVRNPNVWFAPEADADGRETYDEVLSAGYFELDTDDGDEILAITGEYKGLCAIFTRHAVFVLHGTGFEDWRIDKVADNAGCFGQRAVLNVAGDLWFAGPQGISALRPVQEYGDVATGNVTVRVDSLFSHVGSRPTSVVPQLSHRIALQYEKESDTVFLLFPQAGTLDDQLYLFNMNNSQWYGPWLDNYKTIGTGYVSDSEPRSLLVGGSNGQVSFRTRRQDQGTTVVLESQVLTGRSLDPRLVGMEKTWRNLRLVVNPVGQWNVQISHKTEDGAWVTDTRSMGHQATPEIGGSFEVGASAVEGDDEPHVIDLKLDRRGVSLKFKITAAAPLLSALLWEVEFSADGYEKGDL